MRLTLKASLIAVVVTLVTLLAVQGWVALSKMTAVNPNTVDIATDWLPSVKVLGEIKFHVTRVRLNGIRLATADAALRVKAKAQLESYAKTLREEMDKYERLISSPEERKLWQEFLRTWSTYETLQRRATTMADHGDVPGAFQLINEDGLAVFVRLDC